MKKIKFLMVALVAILGLSSCEKHVYDDHTADMVGTWTCLQEGFAEALTISADGSVVSTGYDGEDFWENIEGKIVVEKGVVTMIFEDHDNYQGHFDIIPGMAFSINNEVAGRFTYNYCKEDLSEELVGMWVCNFTPSAGENEMMIQTFSNNGKSILTGFLPMPDGSEQVLNNETNYKVAGDLLFIEIPADKFGGEKSVYVVDRLVYSPNGTNLGDIMTLKSLIEEGNQVTEVAMSFLRIKESLSLSGEKYDYRSIYVTNVKGLDQDFMFGDQKLNFSKLDGAVMDKMMKNILFNVSFPAADKISYNCYFNGKMVETVAPIAVDGNKVTIKMSERNPVYRDIDIYCFQDAGNHQFHMYMSTTAFTNFFANISVVHLADRGLLDLTDDEAVAAVFEGVDNSIETINVSIVMENPTKSL